jgi:hypothetical protein
MPRNAQRATRAVALRTLPPSTAYAARVPARFTRINNVTHVRAYRYTCSALMLSIVKHMNILCQFGAGIEVPSTCLHLPVMDWP